MIRRKNILFFGIALGLGIIVLAAHRASAPTHKLPGSSSANGFNKKQFSLDDPASPWVIVNKSRPLPTSYQPTKLVVPKVRLRLGPGAEQMQVSPVIAQPLEELFKAAQQASLQLTLASGYRSAAYQKVLYDGYVTQNGQAAADQLSARPGYSEHQTGLAVDVGGSHGCLLEACFGDTPEGKWLSAHAHEYGFIIRYQKDKEKLTGYSYEPWHVRYVGKELASKVHQTNQTLEEFFGLPAPIY